MKNSINKEKMNFNVYCKKAMKEAIIKASAFVDRLNLIILKNPNRLGRIYNEIDALLDEMEVLNRVNYILHALNLPTLFQLFEKMNHLHDAEELAKLKQAFYLVEKYRRLQMLIIESFAMEEVENLKARLWALKAVGVINAFDKNNKEETSLQKQDINPRKAYNLLSDIRIKPVRKITKNQTSFGYGLPDDSLLHVFYDLFHQLDLLDPQTSVETFYMMMTCEDWTIFQVKIYLGCKTNEFKYIINRLKKYFTSLSLAKIGRSELFISNTGHLINNSNLTSAKVKKISTRDTIDKIFRDFDKYYCHN